MRIPSWLISAAGTALCAALLIAGYFRPARNFDAAAMIACLPPDQATHVFVAVGALRDAGVLNLIAGSKSEEEPDYRKFVEQTGFDYRTDLDAVAAAFFHGGSYYTIRGRFDWKKLNGYARAQGGDCVSSICSM